MRRIALSGLVALAAVLGGALSASAASGLTGPASPRPLASGAAPASAGFFPGFLTFINEAAAVSCGSAKSCLAVGSDYDGSGREIPTADAWNGKAWKPLTVSLPKGASGSLTGVSCKAASCLAIGSYITTSGSISVFAVTWNGKSLKGIPAPARGGGDGFGVVSCVTARDCVSIGDSIGSTAETALISTWNGSKWRARAAAIAADAAEEFTSISCLSATYCVVGGMANTFAGPSETTKPLLASWNGRTLTAMKVPTPAGRHLSAPMINEVSCASKTSCAAVGYDSTDLSATTGLGFTEVLSGKTWKEGTVAWPKGTSLSFLSGISCTSASRCLAVGAAGSASGGSAVALSYNGKTWTRQTNLPGPGKGNSDYFGDVTCLTATDCVGVGQIGNTSENSARLLSGFWNGSSWKLVAA